ncbi:MAG: AAA family ATPase [Acidobacteria bacterium]|nr:AAA family ATPase [Acidobacteriota bacterium]
MPNTPQVALLFPPYRIPADVDLLYREEKIVPLERRAVQVLRYLVANNDRVISKEELLEAVWPDTFTTDGVLKRAVSQARRALGDVADQAKFIETYHGRGYRFIAKVELEKAESPAKPSEPSGEAAEFAAPIEPPPFAKPLAQPAANGIPDYNQLVGRDAELAQLFGDFRRALDGNGRPVLLIGESGVGKTQLARAFANLAQAQGAVCLYAQFFDYQASRLAPYEIFLDLLRNLLGVTAANRDECDLRAMVKNHFGISLPEELFTDGRLNSQIRQTTNTGALRVEETTIARTGSLTLPRPTGKLTAPASKAVAPISQCFLRASQQRPLVLILDDVQWADEASREVIGNLMRMLQREPLMLVCLARAEAVNERQSAFAEWLKRLAGYRSYTTLSLRPLDETLCRAAIEAVLSSTIEIPPADMQTLHRITGGNPYFLMEMLRLLAAERVVSFDLQPEPHWQWNGFKDLSLPVTIVMAAQAKLDRLSEEVRQLVEMAAVLGEEFRVETLAKMCGRSEDDIEQLLQEAVRRGVLSERGVTGDNDMRFYHNTLRQVLYDGLPPRQRKRLHLFAARAIEGMYLLEPDRVADAVSAHYESGGNWERAFDWGIRAWQAASSRLSWSEAMTCIERARRAAYELAQTSGNPIAPADQLKLLFALGETLFALGKLKESDAVYAEAVSLARAIGDRAGLATALLQQGQTRMSLSLYREAIAVTEQALEIYRAMDDQDGAGLALLQIGGVEVRQGNYDAAIELAQQSLRDVPLNSHVAAIAFGLLGWARALQGHFTEGAPLLERAVDYLSSVGDIQRRVLLLRRSHWAELSRGRYETAIELALRAREDAERLGDANSEAKMDMGIGQARLAQGLYDEAVEMLLRAQQKMHAVGATHGEAETYWLLGRANCERGHLAEARTLLEKSYAMILEIGDRDDEFRVMTDLARLELAEHSPQSALEFADNALVIAEELNNRDGLGVILTERARALLALGQADEASSVIERAIALLEEADSGERWRAYWTKAQILKAQTLTSPETLTAFQQTVALLDDIRQQLAKDDSRFAAVTRARQTPAAELQSLLLQLGQTEKAHQIAQSWKL